MEQAIKWLCELVGDTGDQRWIDWYIFENDYGRKKLESGYDKKLKPITNTDQLWDLIQEGKKQK